MPKLYAHKRYFTTDEVFFEELDKIKQLEKRGKMIEALLYYKKMCNKIRKSLKITCLVGVVDGKNKKTGKKLVFINLYNIDALDDNYFKQTYDKEKQGFYIEIEAQEDNNV